MIKRFVLILILCGIAKVADERPLPIIGEIKEHKKEVYVDFLTTYKRIRYEEGNYINDPVDRGGETYAGIPMKISPSWYGWRYITGKNFKRYQYCKEAELWVKDYYLDIWVDEGFYRLKNQDVANYLFDTRVNISPRQTIKLLNRHHNTNLSYTTEWVNSTLDTIDIQKFRKHRVDYYLALIKRRPEQVRFRKNWLMRALR